jgi:hypothetical protein
MLRKVSRITLQIKNIRVERLQDISWHDAKREGVEIETGPGGMFYPNSYKLAFKDLWNSINESRGFGWNSNCFVWVIEFEKI